MAWTVAGGPADVDSFYDGTIWEWRLAENDRTHSTLVKITRSALLVAEENLPDRTNEALATKGQSEVETVLDWYEPPAAIELGTWSDSPRYEGGAPESPDETAAVDEIKQWFRDRGIDLYFDRFEGGWTAPLVPHDQPVGVGDYGLGGTRREAAQDARLKFEAGEQRDLTVQAPPATAEFSAPPPSIERDTSHEVDVRVVGGIPSAEEFGVPEVRRQELERVAAEFGWAIGFTSEPDGSFHWFVFARETGELLQSGQAENWDDAKIESIVNLYPPSEEGKNSS